MVERLELSFISLFQCLQDQKAPGPSELQEMDRWWAEHHMLGAQLFLRSLRRNAKGKTWVGLKAPTRGGSCGLSGLDTQHGDVLGGRPPGW